MATPQPQVYQMSDVNRNNQMGPSVPLFQPGAPGIHKKTMNHEQN